MFLFKRPEQRLPSRTTLTTAAFVLAGSFQPAFSNVPALGPKLQPAHPSVLLQPCPFRRATFPSVQSHRAGLYIFSRHCHPSTCRTIQGFLGTAELISHINIPLGEGSALCCWLAALGRGRAVRGDIHINFSL